MASKIAFAALDKTIEELLGLGKTTENPFLYSGKSFLNLFVCRNTEMTLQQLFCFLNFSAQEKAKVSTRSLSISLSEIISIKLLVVAMDCLGDG